MSLHGLAMGVWLWGLAYAGTGCGGCSVDEPAPMSSTSAVSELVAVPEAMRSAAPSRRLHDLDLTPTMVVLQSGPKVWMWADGRSHALSHALDSVSWSERGFEFATANGLTRVLAPGGGIYYRVGPTKNPSARPIREQLRQGGEAPLGFDIQYVAGAGGSRVQAVLHGPEGREVRLGLFTGEPERQAWLTAQLPDVGQGSPALSAMSSFRRDEDGHFLSPLPDGADPLPSAEIPPSKVARWLVAAQAFRKSGEPLTVGTSRYLDLDRDGVNEAVICLNGEVGMLEPRCILVDETEGETRFYAAGLPWVEGGNEPEAFAVDDAPYLMMVAKGDPSVALVLRYYGAGWIVEPVR